MDNLLDNQGCIINVGDDIVWATRRGNSGCINVGTVHAILDKGRIQAIRKSGKLVILENPDRIVVVSK